jgi:phenylacetic acid degradation operon negative regulatory protein
MCRAGLIKPRKQGKKSYYSLTEKGRGVVAEGAKRVFERRADSWRGHWNLVIYSLPETKRKARDKLRHELKLLGYGALTDAVWISPHDISARVKGIVEELEIGEHVQVFNSAKLDLGEPADIVSRCWDIGLIHEKYQAFIDEFEPRLDEYMRGMRAGKQIDASECFVATFRLVHAYRALPFYDPDLPPDLLPENWLRPKADSLFREFHSLLIGKAQEYFYAALKEY